MYLMYYIDKSQNRGWTTSLTKDELYKYAEDNDIASYSITLSTNAYEAMETKLEQANKIIKHTQKSIRDIMSYTPELYEDDDE